jgi:hypothetical protein
MVIGKRLRELRESKSLSQGDIGTTDWFVALLHLTR